jgi:osmoprotectant transport system permease protein
MLFTDGLQRNFVTEVVVGIVAILLLALLMDAILVVLERLLTPWTRASAASARSDAKTGAEFIAETHVHAGAGS